jgi:phage tail-like protein
VSKRGDRLLSRLPAIYRQAGHADRSGDFRKMLATFEAIMFESEDGNSDGLAEQIDALPTYFAPLGVEGPGSTGGARTPGHFLAWLAGWVAFSPHHLFAEAQLRRIVAGIVPMYGRRGTRRYVEDLVRLCFDEVRTVVIDENPGAGFELGRARVGGDSSLTLERPFCFRVFVEVGEGGRQPGEPPESRASLEHRLRALIDFAKPAHTEYELDLSFGDGDENQSERQADAPG